MGFRDPFGDRQAKPGSAGAPCTGGVASVETGEDAGSVRLGEPGTVVGDDDEHVVRLGLHPDLDAGVGRVCESVVDESRDELLDLVTIDLGGHGSADGDVRLDPAVRATSPGVGDDIVRQLADVNGGELERACFVQPCQLNKVFDQPSHSPGLVSHPPHDVVELTRVTKAALCIEVEVAANRCERRAKLMGGIGDEPAQLVLGLVALVEHHVEGTGQFSGFGRPLQFGGSALAITR